MTNVREKQDSGKLNECRVIDLAPAKVIADIVGTSPNHVNKVRRGVRGKKSLKCQQIKFADQYMSDLIKKGAIKAKDIITPPRD